MTDANHEKRIKKMEAEMVELRKQIMQIEFVSKRDTAVARKEHEKVSAHIDKQIKHISTIMRITYDELNMFDEKIQESGRILARPRKRSTMS
jgi:phage shock protein A